MALFFKKNAVTLIFNSNWFVKVKNEIILVRSRQCNTGIKVALFSKNAQKGSW